MGLARVASLLVCCAACNQAELVQPPEAGVDACVAQTVLFCDASVSDAAGCVGEPGDAASSDAAFPVGCTANVIGSTRDPNTGVCALVASCNCVAADASSPQWACSP